MVAAPRTEAQRTAVQDDYAERPRGQLYGTTVQRGPENGCVGRLCRKAVQAERPRGWLCGQRGPEAETGLLHEDSL